MMYLRILVVIAGALLASPAAAAGSEPVAMVTDIKGSATLTETGKQKPLTLLYYRRQLVQVPDEHNLYSTKRPATLGSVDTQKSVHTIQEVGAHHGDFIYNHGLQALVESVGIGRDTHLTDFLNGYVGFKTKE